METTTESIFTPDTTFNDTNITTSVPLTTVASNSLSAGAIAGIVIGIFAGLCLLTLFIYLLYKYRHRIWRKESTTMKSRSAKYEEEQKEPKLRMEEEEGVYITVNNDTARRNPTRPPRLSNGTTF